MNPRLKHLLRLASQKPADAPEPELPRPGFATRVAARWATEKSSPLALWESASLAALALALIICGTSLWLRPAPQEDVFTALLTARAAAPDDFPF